MKFIGFAEQMASIMGHQKVPMDSRCMGVLCSIHKTHDEGDPVHHLHANADYCNTWTTSKFQQSQSTRNWARSKTLNRTDPPSISDFCSILEPKDDEDDPDIGGEICIRDLQSCLWCSSPRPLIIRDEPSSLLLPSSSSASEEDMPRVSTASSRYAECVLGGSPSFWWPATPLVTSSMSSSRLRK